MKVFKKQRNKLVIVKSILDLAVKNNIDIYIGGNIDEDITTLEVFSQLSDNEDDSVSYEVIFNEIYMIDFEVNLKCNYQMDDIEVPEYINTIKDIKLLFSNINNYYNK